MQRKGSEIKIYLNNSTIFLTVYQPNGIFTPNMETKMMFSLTMGMGTMMTTTHHSEKGWVEQAHLDSSR